MSRPAAYRSVGRIRIRLVLVALTSAALSVVVAPAPAGAADGALDPTYGVDGEAGLAFGPWVEGHAAAARADGGLVVVGRQGPGEDGRGAWALWGVTGGGASDPQWGEGGLVTYVVGEDGGTAEAVAVQDDGGVVVGGNGSVGGQSHAFLVRFTATGDIDTSFGDGGVRDLGPGGVRSVALREDGSVVAAGFTYLSTSWGGAYAAVRVSVVDEHGGLVDDFGDGGQATQALGSENADSVGEGVLVRSDGSLWVTGSAWWDPDEAVDVLLARFSSSGALQGAVRTPLGDASSRDAAGLDIAAGPDGTAVVSGRADGATKDQLAVLRYTAQGELDPAFGTKGVTLTSLGADTAEGRAVVVDDAGTVLVGGWTEGGSGGQFALARFTPSGQPDTGFGDGGRVRQPLSSTWSRAGGLVVDSQNRAVLAGYTGSRFAAARFTGAFPSAVAPPPAASIGDATVAEGGSGTTDATLPVSLDRAPTTSVSVGWATSDGTATAPADYQATSGTVTFAAGQQTAQVTVPVQGDTADEPDETVLVDLSAPSGLTVADGHAVLTVTDDDPPASTPPAASVGTPATVDEGQALAVPREPRPPRAPSRPGCGSPPRTAPPPPASTTPPAASRR